jgi:hypothetical protein
VPVFRRVLGSDECAVVLRRRAEPLLIRGPGGVRTFGRWRRVSFVDLDPFVAHAVETDVRTNDGIAMAVRGDLEAQVVDPVAAVVNVVDYEDATRLVLRTAMRALVMGRSSAEVSGGRQLEPHVADEVVEALRSWGVAVRSLSFDVATAAER